MMKKTFAILLSALLIASFAACGTTKNVIAPVAPVAPSSSETSSAATDSPSTADMAISDQPIVVADATLFTGVVDDFAVSDNGKTVWMLKSDDGKTLKATIDDNTKFSFDSNGVGNGARLEVYYNGTEDIVTAIAVNRLEAAESGTAPLGAPVAPEGAMTYDGVVVAITVNGEGEKFGSDGSIEMTDDKGENAYIFNFAKETTYYGVDLATVKKGDKLRILHSQIATRSIPPQSPALQILPAQE